MSINAKIDNVTYQDIKNVIIGDKDILLEQIQESTDDTNPWEGSLQNTKSIGYMIDCMEKATNTGTFVGGSTVSFDTGLGSNIKYLVILDESAEALPLKNSTAIEGIYMLTYDFELLSGYTIYSMAVTASYCQKTSFNTTTFNRAKSVKFENGAFEYVPSYDGNALYNNFTPNHTYRWFAW